MKSVLEWTRRFAVFLWATPVMVCTVFIPGLVFTPVLAAQDNENGLLTENPLDEIRDELVRVLEEANLPFTPEQEDSITFVLEESRRASENLFGNVMNFSGGPPRGEDLDRALAGIAWINEDFSERVAEYLTAEQRVVWDAHTASRDAAAQATEGSAGTSRQVQQIRVNRNPFTAENQFSGNASSGGSYGFSSGGGIQTQIINRGGTGAWHGNYSFNLRDEALDARNPFASNKPTYQQRNINLNTSGPLIRDRLTFGGTLQSKHAGQRVDGERHDARRPGPGRIYATPGVSQRRLQRHLPGHRGPIGRVQLQTGKGSTLLSRGWEVSRCSNGVSTTSAATTALRSATSGSHRNAGSRTFPYPRSSSNRNRRREQRARPSRVLGAFNGGGGSNRTHNDNSGADFRSLWIYSGDRWTIRTGWDFRREATNERSENNFDGSFIFSDLDSFREGRPILYTQNQGDPVLEISQSQWSAFFQNEFQATDRITLFFGLRYERQTNLADRDNLDPRVGVAFALDNSTVVRAGAGVFHMRVGRGIQNTLARFDGSRQFQIVIENPSYPDPFLAGDVTVVTPSSRRVQAQDLSAPYSVNTSYQIERSLPGNLFVTASFDYHRGFHVLRSRNLNAPLPGLTERPNPAEGNVWQLESSGISRFRAIRPDDAAAVQHLQRERHLWAASQRQRPYELRRPDRQFQPARRLRRNGPAPVQRPDQQPSVLGDFSQYEYHLPQRELGTPSQPAATTTATESPTTALPACPRNSVRGPHQGNVSFNLTKSFSLGGNGNGGPSLNLRANFNNAFNRTNLGNPVGILTSPFFGRSIRATNPRQNLTGDAVPVLAPTAGS